MEIVRLGGGGALKLKGFCQEINGDFFFVFFFLHFSVIYNVSFT